MYGKYTIIHMGPVRKTCKIRSPELSDTFTIQYWCSQVCNFTTIIGMFPIYYNIMKKVTLRTYVTFLREKTNKLFLLLNFYFTSIMIYKYEKNDM